MSIAVSMITAKKSTNPELRSDVCVLAAGSKKRVKTSA